MSYIHWTDFLGNQFFTSVVDGVDADAHAKELLALGGVHDGCTYSISDTQPVIAPTKEEQNAPILEQLLDIDKRSIRALRENDATRIADLENQAAALRLKLVK